jgi:hypothetical protein
MDVAGGAVAIRVALRLLYGKASPQKPLVKAAQSVSVETQGVARERTIEVGALSAADECVSPE